MRAIFKGINDEKISEQDEESYVEWLKGKNAEKKARSVKETYKKDTSDRVAVTEKFLEKQGINIDVITDNLKAYGTTNWKTKSLKDGFEKVKMSNIVLKDTDNRSDKYKIKTGLHEAFHAMRDGMTIKRANISRAEYQEIEECLTECSAHYLAGLLGIKNLQPNYANKLSNLVPRLVQLEEFKGCESITEIGERAFKIRASGKIIDYDDLHSQLYAVQYDWQDYIKSNYLKEIESNDMYYVGKFIENAPAYEGQDELLLEELDSAIFNLKAGTTLSDKETSRLQNALAMAMNRKGGIK